MLYSCASSSSSACQKVAQLENTARAGARNPRLGQGLRTIGDITGTKYKYNICN